ncbi:hypothetical protein P9250_16100 [Caballeronia sp. LP006]|uniref:hypothetical protein n=1 Tax=unclassified Caballeronia TaxID=2646786 RepID=UPI001FD37F38|nr:MULTISPECIES: hypothetical protein [unclassified Caballeronia]MDR5775003.1 hypothetical protein [Caballeronia sp. LZ002]MDR5801291.1 hypothetical protein [Caballeronia sp. LZ001]MDR5829410.1 hypothetical protein [Caballeronia sp. LP006]MDR5850439.1 hypothetical protein [Caballeronia sp. LZ003]
MFTLAEAFQELLDSPSRKRLLIAAQGGTANCHWLPAYVGKHGEFRCDPRAANIEIDDDAAEAIRLFSAGSLSSCALVVHLGELGVGALVMGPESPSDAMRMLEQLKANALGRFVENYLAELQQRRPAKVYPFKPR